MDRLAKSLDFTGDVSYTCETAQHFYSLYLSPKIDQYLRNWYSLSLSSLMVYACCMCAVLLSDFAQREQPDVRIRDKQLPVREVLLGRAAAALQEHLLRRGPRNRPRLHPPYASTALHRIEKYIR